MKKLVVLVAALILTFVIGSAAMASTMGVNVSPGFSFDIERDHVFSDSDFDYWTVRFNAGLSEKALLKLTYTTFDEFDDDVIALGLRYEIVDNLAFVANYASSDEEDSYNIGLRGKAKLSDAFALVGELTYNDSDVDGADSVINFYGQAEFYIGEVAAINLGIDVSDEDDSDPYYCVGAEYYFNKAVTAYFDYYMYDDSDANDICFGVEFAF